MSAELILGTAQLGGAYGINNEEGELSQVAAFNVLDTAYDEGIRILDTAEGYGNSESIIGDYHRSSNKLFKVCTKLSGQVDLKSSNYKDGLRVRLGTSLDKLSVRSTFIYYLHDFSMGKNKELLNFLLTEKAEGRIENIGISIYEPGELEYILCNIPEYIDVVQIPLNALNCAQWLDSDLLLKAREHEIKIAARSIYLQGLLFKDPEDTFVRKLGLSEQLAAFRKMAQDLDLSIAQTAYAFIQNIESVSWVLMGCETPHQVKENAKMLHRSFVWPKELLHNEIRISQSILPKAIDPRYW